MKPKNRKVAKARLWKVFSEYVRRRDSDWRGYAPCISCGKVFQWKEMDAGHFIGRENTQVFVHEQNVNAQCKYCNNYKAGRQYETGKGIDVKYGEGTADNILMLSKTRTTYSLEDFWMLEKIYKEKVKKLILTN